MTDYARPLPTVTKLTAPYWEGAQQGELRLQHCRDCRQPWFPPAEACPACLSSRYDWRAVSGRGSLWSWIDMWQQYFRGFEDERPYLVALVELEEGPRLFSTLVECDRAELRCDLPLEVVFDAVTPEITLPKFRPRR